MKRITCLDEVSSVSVAQPSAKPFAPEADEISQEDMVEIDRREEEIGDLTASYIAALINDGSSDAEIFDTIGGSLIAEIADAVECALADNGILIYHPAVIEDDGTNTSRFVTSIYEDDLV